jgi:hypothetical protein
VMPQCSAGPTDKRSIIPFSTLTRAEAAGKHDAISLYDPPGLWMDYLSCFGLAPFWAGIRPFR